MTRNRKRNLAQTRKPNHFPNKKPNHQFYQNLIRTYQILIQTQTHPSLLITYPSFFRIFSIKPPQSHGPLKERIVQFVTINITLSCHISQLMSSQNVCRALPVITICL